jgi:glycosyltransferase involved in cell wall biosynthesis
MDPLVSVVVTAYNQARYIGEALRSVMSQTYPRYEVIVVDDGSTDDTSLRVAEVDGAVTYVRQRNRGVAGARNTGVRRARGDLVAFLDGDDLWEPDKLSMQVEAALRYPSAGLLAVDGVQFDEDGVISPTLLTPGVEECARGRIDGVVCRAFYERLLERNCILTVSQVMVPRRVLETVGPSDQAFPIASDYDLYLRIAARYDVVLVGCRLTRWRYLPTSASGPADRRELSSNLDLLNIWRKHARAVAGDRRYTLERRIYATVERSVRLAYYFGWERDRLWATRYLAKLLTRGPRRLLVAAYLAGLWSPEWMRRVCGRAVRGANHRGSHAERGAS